MKKNKFILLFILSLILMGCSTDNLDNTLARAAGNKPPQFFKFSTTYDANHYMFYEKHFNILMAKTKASDWSKMSGWSGAYIYSGIGMGVDNPDVKAKGVHLGYGINLSSSISKYTERERELERGNVSYIRGRKKWLKNTDKLSIRRLGKENYPCIVVERATNKRGIRKKIVSCYKFNPTKTKAKHVTISLIYTKSPTLSTKYKHLAKQYTYKDLQRRAKRMLDSLYIKDGW